MTGLASATVTVASSVATAMLSASEGSHSTSGAAVVVSTALASASNCAAPSAALLLVTSKVAVKLPTPARSEEHTSELQSLMRISYAVFCLKTKTEDG